MIGIIMKLLGLKDVITSLTSLGKTVAISVTVIICLVIVALSGKSKGTNKVPKVEPKKEITCSEIKISHKCVDKCVWNRSLQRCQVFVEKESKTQCDKFDNGSYKDCIMANVVGGHCEWDRETLDCSFIKKGNPRN